MVRKHRLIQSYYLRSETEIHFDLYVERLRDGRADRYGRVSGALALNAHAKIWLSKFYLERDTDGEKPTGAVTHVFQPWTDPDGLVGRDGRRPTPSHRVLL